ncbi:phage tail protein [Sandaracinobacter sp.]|uniref:GTA baseplate fiber-binding domain-containing protein n=1 Tax=Sandaracinobacter sp. TaxID=2487581 RepID=UPI0035B33C82
MASVLLSTVGQAVGGPFGAGIGAALGAGLDVARMSRAGGADDLYRQQSAYGEIVPRLFGTMRTAGQLIWALPPQAGGGRKGDGRREAEASFAIALSRGPVLEVRRIWADGREIRSAAGECAFGFEMRLHSTPVREPDPLIAAAEGAGGVPAYRGWSHVVLEGFPLGPFGNRIPSLSFELVADETDADAWAGLLAAEAGFRAGSVPYVPGVTGFVAHGMPPSDDIDRAVRLCGGTIGLVDGQLAVGDGTVHAVPTDAVLLDPDADSVGGRIVRDRRPGGLSLGYIDPDRDYLRGLQRRDRSGGGRTIELSWPIAASAGVAASLCHRFLGREEAARERLSLALPHRWLHLSVGDRLTFAGCDWRIIEKEIRELAVNLGAERVERAITGGVRESEAGRSLSLPLISAGPTRLVAFEPPVPLGASGATVAIMGGGGAGWRGAELSVLDAGVQHPVGRLPVGPGVGELRAPLPPGPDTIWDERNVILLTFDGEDGLLGRDHSGVLGGGGLLLVGNELVQARNVERIGGGVVRLSGLLRNRFGTRGAAAGWPAGTAVAEVSVPDLVQMPVAGDAPGGEILLLAQGRGDPPGGTEHVHVIEGVGLAPLAPAHLAVERVLDGSVKFSWIGRSRSTWSWAEGGGEPGQGYIWRCREDGGAAVDRRLTTEGLFLTPTEQVSTFGGLLAGGEFQVEAVGDGPGWVRCSPWMRF